MNEISIFDSESEQPLLHPAATFKPAPSSPSLSPSSPSPLLTLSPLSPPLLPLPPPLLPLPLTFPPSPFILPLPLAPTPLFFYYDNSFGFTFQLLDLMHTLHTRAALIFSFWVVEEQQQQNKQEEPVEQALSEEALPEEPLPEEPPRPVTENPGEPCCTSENRSKLWMQELLRCGADTGLLY